VLKPYAAERKNGHLVLPFESKAQTAVINRLLLENGIDVYRLQPQQNDLEQLFIDITTDKL
jgi:ABC-2 type transport system ATP-binding protein